VLKWAWQHGCPFNLVLDAESDCCTLAAEGGHLEVLKWLHEHHAPWDEWTGMAAAGNGNKGHLDVLKWLRQHDCPWDTLTCDCAASSGNLEVLRWAREHGCPWDPQECRRHAWDQETLALIQQLGG
jgi:hypothetical protein